MLRVGGCTKIMRRPGLAGPVERFFSSDASLSILMKARHARSGVRIKGARGNPEIRAAIIRFAKWLRREYEFPTRVPVYLFPSDQILTMHGDRVWAFFFAPFNRNEEPYIRIATGDYAQLRKERGRDNALAAFLHSFAHELVHYQQWIAGGEKAVIERGVARRARSIVARYALSTDHP